MVQMFFISQARLGLTGAQAQVPVGWQEICTVVDRSPLYLPGLLSPSFRCTEIKCVHPARFTDGRRRRYSGTPACFSWKPSGCLKGFSTRQAEPDEIVIKKSFGVFLTKCSLCLRHGSSLRVLEHKFQSVGKGYAPSWSGLPYISLDSFRRLFAVQK